MSEGEYWNERVRCVNNLIEMRLEAIQRFEEYIDRCIETNNEKNSNIANESESNENDFKQ
jgi:hypothetical protein